MESATNHRSILNEYGSVDRRKKNMSTVVKAQPQNQLHLSMNNNHRMAGRSPIGYKLNDSQGFLDNDSSSVGYNHR